MITHCRLLLHRALHLQRLAPEAHRCLFEVGPSFGMLSARTRAAQPCRSLAVSARPSSARARPRSPAAACWQNAPRRPEAAEPRVEASVPEAEPCAEDTFDWNAKPGPAKFAAFMEAFPADKYGGPAHVPT